MWLGRSLFEGPRLAFVTSEAEFKSAKRAAGLECSDPWLEPGWDACTHAYTDQRGQLVCIVALRLESAARMEPIDVAALLAHEAVHVWQRTADFIGGGDLGREMPAYAVQNISARLMRAYVTSSSRACSVPA